MLDKKMDRRIMRTRNLLRQALMGLILEKEYDAITVENITERADLGRATFYLHYHDKTELLLESIDVIADALIAEASEAGYIPGPSPVSHVPLTVRQQTQAIMMVFHHAQQNPELWRIILRGEGMTVASMRIREILGKIAGNYFDEKWRAVAPGGKHELPTLVVANYFAAALMGLLMWWLESGRPYPADEMAETFRILFFKGAYMAAGLNVAVDESKPERR